VSGSVPEISRNPPAEHKPQTATGKRPGSATAVGPAGTPCSQTSKASISSCIAVGSMRVKCDSHDHAAIQIASNTPWNTLLSATCPDSAPARCDDGQGRGAAAVTMAVGHVAATATHRLPPRTPRLSWWQRVPLLYGTRLRSRPALLPRVSGVTWVFVTPHEALDRRGEPPRGNSYLRALFVRRGAFRSRSCPSVAPSVATRGRAHHPATGRPRPRSWHTRAG
jgi:hypothetical protein